MEMGEAATGRLSNVHRDIDRILIDRQQIARRIRELGIEIRRDLEGLDDDVEVVLIPILTGSIIFVADLIRELPQKIRISVVTSSSYVGKATKSSGDPQVSVPSDPVEGKHVLIIDDILDSGTTIRRVRSEIQRRSPRSVRCCVLLRKSILSALETPCEYIGFDTPDEFLVGYGLDYDGYYRNLPDIGVLKKEAL